MSTCVNLVRDLMETHPDSWKGELEKLAIDITPSLDGRLVTLKYNQIESPMANPLVQQCRGMVVDVSRRKVMAWPYHKFWNYGEGHAAVIDWAVACVQEKLDGSLMLLYWDDMLEMWCVASSGIPDASGDFGDTGTTFGAAFWTTWSSLGMRVPEDEEARAWTYMFEMCDLPNRVVVRQVKPRIVLHGMRHLESGEERRMPQLRMVAEANNWEVVRSFPIDSVEACLAAAAELDPLEQEGYVVVDRRFNRVKIKSPKYVALHHLKGEGAFTTRRAIRLWQTGECSEVLAHFPELAPKILPVHAHLDRAVECAFKATDVAFVNSYDRKSFALLVKDLPYSATCFRLYQNHGATLEEAGTITRSFTVPALESLLEKMKERP